MANKNLIALIEYAAKTMEADFENSKELFKADKRNRTFHAAEFGAYRERIVSKFLRLILPPNYEIGSGFIITPEGDISSQCDVIIYDRDETTVFNDPQHSRLFPIETVIAVIEVKSDLNSRTLNAALEKLSKIKALRTRMINPRIKITGKNLFDQINRISQNAHENVLMNSKFLSSFGYCREVVEHQIGTFIICNKITGVKDFSKIFVPAEFQFSHNAILSLKNGIIVPISSNGFVFPYYVPLRSSFNIIKDPHCLKFIDSFRKVTRVVKTFEFDITKYIEKQENITDHITHLCVDKIYLSNSYNVNSYNIDNYTVSTNNFVYNMGRT